MIGWLAGPVLGIETSCDETSAAVVREGEILGQVIASQDAHAAFGGVVPEIAARAHLWKIDRVVERTLEAAGMARGDLGAVGVTAGPGLVGSLLVGVNWAKAFALARRLPLLGVHHMEAHLYAGILEHPELRPPFVALLVSGGHTILLHAQEWGRYLLLGRTRDDAAGEAFDKVARHLGLAYPGGPEVERVARRGTPGRYALPRPMLRRGATPGDDDYFDLSFSGLKTAVVLLTRELEREGSLPEAVADVAAEFQAAAVEVLVEKTMRAVELTRCPTVLVGGGVAGNLSLRSRLAEKLGSRGRLVAASPRLSTDNGAMVACLAAHRLGRGERSGSELNADPDLPFPGLVPWDGDLAGWASNREERACIRN
ncbi:MAG: tRNA (adenosine(37)-N6)-threonylcarbamoyltransferase complex transferase subunit TsaD [Gemmatimonadota bacterium]